MYGTRARNPLQAVADPALQPWLNAPVVDLRGARVGTLDTVLHDPENDLRWLWVNVAPRGGLRFALIPAAGALYGNGRLFVAHDRELIKRVPQSGERTGFVDGALRSESYRHYGLIGLPRRRNL